MATTTAQRRKGGAPRSQDGIVQVQNYLNGTNGSNGMTIPEATLPVATVKRNKFGTSPFDENWLNLDCCGLSFAFITYALLCYGMYAVCLILLPPWMSETDELGVRSMTWAGHGHRLAFTVITIMAMAAHFKAMTTDPGAVPPDAMPLDINQPQDTNGDSANGDAETPSPKKGRRLCRRCKAFKPNRAHHCSICKRCIIKMDHHCPWVNNCVGIGNHKYFLLFIFYTFVSCAYAFTLVLVRFFSCMSRHGHVRTHHMTCLDKPSDLLSILGLLVEAILFGLFTCCMMFDQMSVVTSKMTHIDRLKGEGDEAGSALAGIIEVFGVHIRRGNDTRFRPDWLSPFTKVCFPASLKDEIMGFCKPCGGNKETELTSRPTNAPMVRSVAEIV